MGLGCTVYAPLIQLLSLATRVADSRELRATARSDVRDTRRESTIKKLRFTDLSIRYLGSVLCWAIKCEVFFGISDTTHPQERLGPGAMALIDAR